MSTLVPKVHKRINHAGIHEDLVQSVVSHNPSSIHSDVSSMDTLDKNQQKKVTMTDYDWWCAHRLELAREHPQKHLAILDQKIVGIGDTALEAFSQSRKIEPNRRPLLTKTSSLDFGY